MVRLRALWRLLGLAVHGVLGVAIIFVAFPWLGQAKRRRTVAWWSARQLGVLGVRLQAHGAWHAGAKLIVANHVSWLDIAAVHALCPEARFVSKADVKHWPLIGRLTAAADTLFIEREKKRDALRVVHQMAERLAAGDTVAVFPEGTTGTGHGVLPFHANLLQAAVAHAVPLQPVVLAYADAQQPVSEAVTFIGETTLLQSLWRVACASALEVHVRVLSPLATAHADRRALAAHVHDVIGTALAEMRAHR